MVIYIPSAEHAAKAEADSIEATKLFYQGEENRLVRGQARYAGGFDTLLQAFPDLSPLVTRLKEWLERLIKTPTSGGLYLYGPVGTCKTGLSWGLAIEALRRHRQIAFWETLELLDRICDTYEMDAEERKSNIIEELARVDILFLDDVGTESPTPHALTCLYQIFDARYSALLPVVATSNLSITQFASRAAQKDALQSNRIFSRLKDYCDIIEVGGADRRGLAPERGEAMTSHAPPIALANICKKGERP